MHRLAAGVSVLLLTTAFAVFAPAAVAKPPEVYPLAKVKAGQKGYGITVFSGTTPERFEFEVIGVLRNFLPKMNLVLVKSEDPKITATNFAQGMSGSPLFIDGKVMCAFSYAFRFNKISMGGCTPLEYMVEEAATPARGYAATTVASSGEWDRYALLDSVVATHDTDGASRSSAWLMRSPLPTMPTEPDSEDSGGLQRAGVPLSVSGLGPTAFAMARSSFSPYGLEPVKAGGGGGGSADSGPSKFEMGGAIAVVLASGDMSMAGTGTVSYIDGDKVIAFGHPMFQMGESYMPISTAEIHTIVASTMTAFKLSSPLRVLGTLVQDRQTMIAGDTSRTFDMIPVDVKVKGPTGTQEFHSQVVRNRFLTPQLVSMAVVSAAQLLAPDTTDTTVTVVSTLYLKGYKPLAFTDYGYSADGSVGTIASARGLRIIAPILFNPWSAVTVERVTVDVEIEYVANMVDLLALRLPDDELPFGKKVYLEAQLRPYGKKAYWEKIPIVVPERYAGQTLRVEIVAGDYARLDIAPPENMDQLVAALRKTYPANTLVATIYVPDEGVTMNGKIVPDLPDSAIDTVRPATNTMRADGYRSLVRVVVPAKAVVQGRQEIAFKVAERR